MGSGGGGGGRGRGAGAGAGSGAGGAGKIDGRGKTVKGLKISVHQAQPAAASAASASSSSLSSSSSSAAVVAGGAGAVAGTAAGAGAGAVRYIVVELLGGQRKQHEHRPSPPGSFRVWAMQLLSTPAAPSYPYPSNAAQQQTEAAAVSVVGWSNANAHRPTYPPVQIVVAGGPQPGLNHLKRPLGDLVGVEVRVCVYVCVYISVLCMFDVYVLYCVMRMVGVFVYAATDFTQLLTFFCHYPTSYPYSLTLLPLPTDTLTRQHLTR